MSQTRRMLSSEATARRNRPTSNPVLHVVGDLASISFTLWLTTSRLIWLAVSTACAGAIRRLRESSWNTFIRWSSASSAPISPGASLRRIWRRRSS